VNKNKLMKAFRNREITN